MLKEKVSTNQCSRRAFPSTFTDHTHAYTLLNIHKQHIHTYTHTHTCIPALNRLLKEKVWSNRRSRSAFASTFTDHTYILITHKCTLHAIFGTWGCDRDGDAVFGLVENYLCVCFMYVCMYVCMYVLWLKGTPFSDLSTCTHAWWGLITYIHTCIHTYV
jgi:hypothetical protein